MIFCFSGTGNSRHVACEIASRFCDTVIEINRDLIDGNTQFEIPVGDRVVWVFPVYSWGIPPVVVGFMRKVSLGNCNAGHYMVCTCGDDIGLAHKQWRRIMAERGWLSCASFSVQMPNTYTLMKGFDVDSGVVIKEKLASMPKRLETILGRIAGNYCGDDVITGSFAWLKSRIVYPYFVRFCMSPRPFHATDRCIGCGKCVRECPMSNVEMDESSSPQWGSRCALCLRCYHTCPKRAVQYGKSTAGKGQYIYPKEC